MGRRIKVGASTGPDNQDLVVQLPEGKRFKEVMGTVAKISSMKVDQLRGLNDPKNWVNLLGKFGYEKAISDRNLP